MKVVSILAAALAVLALAACSGLKPDDTVRSFYDAVRAGDGAKVRSLAAPELQGPSVDAELAKLRRILPAEAPTKAKGLSRSIRKTLASGETLETQELYEVGARKVVVAAMLRRADTSQPWKVQGFHVRVLTPTELKVNAFTFEGKTPLHFGFLAATVLAPALMIAAIVKVVRRKGLRRKWLWIILALAGAATFQMNWTTGAVAVNLTLQLIGAGVMTTAPGLTPWILTFTLPIGAILILIGFWANPARAKPAKALVKSDARAFD